MASPFSIFRKYQRVGMAILAIGAMFLFTFDIVIYNWRNRSMSGGGSGPVAVESTLGNLSSADIGDLMKNRRLANQFLTQAILKTRFSPEILRLFQQQPQFLNQIVGQSLFGFGRSTSEEDVAIGWILGQQGRKMGIVVDDIQVEAFLESQTDRKLSTKLFKEIVKELGTSPKVLYDALREELLAQQAWLTTIPQAPRTPIDFWRYYKNLNVRQRVDLAAVPVEQFLSKVADPSEAELKAYFEKHKNDYETLRDEVPVPGFKQPVKARLQYVVAKFDAAEKEVAEKDPVTDTDIEKYYEENKSLLYRERPTAPTGDMPPSPGAGGPESGDKPKEGDKPVTPEVTPEGDAAKKPEEAKPADSKPADPKPEDKKPEEKKPEEPKPEEKKPEPEAKPEPETKPDAPKPEAPKPEAGESKPETAPEKPEASDQSSLSPRRTGLRVRLASFADEPAKSDEPAKPEEGAKPGEKPAEEKPAPEEKPAEEKPAADKPGEKPAEEKPADAPKPASDTPAAPKPGDPPADDKPAADGVATPAPEEVVKYRPLDDDLKQEIREKLVAQRAAKRVSDRLDKAADALLDAGRKLGEKYMQTKLTAEQEAAVVLEGKDAFTAIAKEQGLEYGETDLVSIPKFRDIPGIGSAREASASDLMDRGENEGLIVSIFGNEQTRLPLRAVDPGTSNRYLFWKIQHSAAHVAEFNEPGVKEQVLLAWKTEKARPLAMNRAAELAKKVQAAGDKSMAEALGETTVTGDKEGLQLVVHNSPEFTWLRERSAPGPRGDATTPEVSVLPFVEKAGRKFMETVFDGLDVGGTGVAPNADDSVYYVVKVLERPFDAGTAREQLMTTPLFGRSTGIGGSPYDQLAQNESSRARFEYASEIEKKYAVKYRLRERNENE